MGRKTEGCPRSGNIARVGESEEPITPKVEKRRDLFDDGVKLGRCKKTKRSPPQCRQEEEVKISKSLTETEPEGWR